MTAHSRIEPSSAAHNPVTRNKVGVARALFSATYCIAKSWDKQRRLHHPGGEERSEQHDVHATRSRAAASTPSSLLETEEERGDADQRRRGPEGDRGVPERRPHEAGAFFLVSTFGGV